jgi:GTPase SAR1 family protein
MLVGNKCDLPNRAVPYNVAMEFARTRNMGYLEVSAKTGANILNSFNCLIRGNILKYNYSNRDIQKHSLLRGAS